MQYTRKDVEATFSRFIACIGGEVGNEKGMFNLEHSSAYGGYKIIQVINDGGGITDIFGSTRRNGEEMVNTIHFALQVGSFMRMRNESRTE